MMDLHYKTKYTRYASVGKILFLLIGMFFSISSYATHIVGGDMTYECLGNDRYEITLMVYRDCVNANPEADFDDPASIAIYDQNNNLQVHLGQLGQILIPFNADDTLRQESDCILSGSGVCVHRTVYKMIATLPFIEGGYTLAYQRCCRNTSLTNIIDPLQTGATFVVEMSEQALAECNSSPTFSEWPPIFICVNEPLEYNHMATDADGDSLVYSLCAPYMGGSFERPIPQPASRPPYDQVIWRSPYNLQNLLGGDQALSIDQQGVLTAIPNTIGQFLVGICVEEYRDGQLISSTRRDFEYNVFDCSGDGPVLTGFAVDTSVVCADVVDIVVTDNSNGVPEGAPYTYKVSSDKGLDLVFNDPDFTFQVNGQQTITITQMVEVSSECTTTKSQTISLNVYDTGLGFSDTMVVCEGSSIALNPNFNSLYTYTWNPTTYLQYADGPNPISTPEESITYEVTVFDPIRNCEITESLHIQVVANPGVTADFEVEKPCGSLTLTFINTSVGADTFVWTFGDPNNVGFVSNEKDPVYTYSSGGTYDVVLTIPGDDCNTIRTKRLAVTGDDFVDFEKDLDNCGPSLIDLNTGLNPLYKYRWEENPLISDPTVAVPEVYLKEDASFKVTVIDPLNDSCQIEGIVNVTIGDQLVVDLGDSLFICEPGSIALNPDGDPNLIYMWTPEGPLDDPSSFNPTASVTEETRFVAKITDPADSSCMVRIPLLVKLGLDDGGFDDGDSLTICDSSTFFLNPGANPNLVYSWSPTTGLSDPNHPNPIASPSESIAYTATISDSAGVCTIMKTIFIEIVDSDVLLGFDKSKECNSLTVMFINQSRGATTYQWTFGDPENPDFVSTEENPTYTYPVAGTYDVELRSSDDPNCTAISAMRITLTGEDFMDFVDTIEVCDPREIPLNPNRNPAYIYAWMADPAIADTTEPNPIVALTEDRTFMVTVTDPLNDTCTIKGTVVVITDDRLTRGLRDSVLTCMAGPVELNPGGNPDVSYMWTPAELLDDPTSFNPTAMITETTVFTVKIVDPDDESCMVEAEVKVVLADYVKLITSEAVDMACPGDSVLLSAKGELLDTFTWCNPSGEEIGSEESFTIALTESGYYRIKGNVGDCEYVDSVFLGLRTLEFTLDKEQPVCADEPVEITVSSNADSRFDSIVWMPEEDIALGQGSEKVTVRPIETTTYTAIVFFEDGCMVMDSITVEVSDLDRFSASADPDTIFFGESTTLTATPEEGATYMWEPSDVLETPDANTTVAIPDQSTTFSVKITDAGGCMTTKEVPVVVIMVQCEPPFVFLPNAFSPNGDNSNDVLFVRGKYIEEMDFFIYDRWGQLVFESHNPDLGWDGTFKGNELAPDVYGYYLRVLCIGGDQHMEKGNVTILQ